MLVVNVEVWPGGDERRKRHVDTLKIGNVSHLADLSDYLFWFGDGPPPKDPGVIGGIAGHRREDGAWELVRKILNQERPA